MCTLTLLHGCVIVGGGGVLLMMGVRAVLAGRRENERSDLLTGSVAIFISVALLTAVAMQAG